MQININNIEQITEKYLDQELTLDDKRQLEETLSKDSVLKKAFEQHRDAILAIELTGIKNEIKDIFDTKDKRTTTKVITTTHFFWKKYIGIAASVLFLVSLGYVFFFQQPHNEELYEQFFYKDEGLPVTMGIADNRTFAQAMNAYKNNDYDKAIEGFTILLNQETNNDTLQYYLAMSFLNENKPQESIALLNQVVAQKETTFRNEAAYFLALAYLKNNHENRAKDILKNCRHEKAKELLDQLK